MIKKVTYGFKDADDNVFYVTKYSIFGLCFYERAVAEDVMRRCDHALSI